MTLYGYARVSVREPEDKNLDLQVERLVRAGCSIWLAVQNLFLAAQALGLGTRITTTHIREEEKIKEWLGIPDYIETVCLTPLGYPRGRFGLTNRKPAAEVTSYNRFGNKD